jgi:short-subunit dehydrogenase
MAMNIVITGSTKGIGLGLAREFLRRGHSVLVTSRGQTALDAAISDLGSKFPPEHIAALPCDVSNYDNVTALWDKAIEAFGSVDIWINNAGRNTVQELFHEVPPQDYVATVQTNLIGLMHCSHVAIRRMREQGHGKIFNMEGFGSNGSAQPKYGPYGATKCALHYFTKVLVKENKDSPVDIFYLSPGMVITDMLASDDIQQSPDWQKRRRIYNILADRVDTVTPWLADGILSAKENGDAVRWLTTPKAMWRFLIARFRKRDIMTPLGM